MHALLSSPSNIRACAGHASAMECVMNVSTYAADEAAVMCFSLRTLAHHEYLCTWQRQSGP